MGMAEQDREDGDQNVIRAVRTKATKVEAAAMALLPHVGATHGFRRQVASLNHRRVVTTPRLNYSDYLAHVAANAYVICPRGAAIDVHRVYEAILLRTVPIYVSPDRPPAVFRLLPVVYVPSVEGLVSFLDDLQPPPAIDWEAAAAHISFAHAEVEVLAAKRSCF
jgi:hypothetical protein